MEKKYSFEVFNTEQVVVKITNTINIDGVIYTVGEPQTTCYRNSTKGREEIKVLPENIQNIILSMWGGAPTVEEKNISQ